MRILTVASALTLLLASPLAAQIVPPAPPKVFTPAPVPDVDNNRGAPADRAGDRGSAQRSSPFSGVPSTLDAGSGQPTPSSLGTADRSTAPAPNLSK